MTTSGSNLFITSRQFLSSVISSASEDGAMHFTSFCILEPSVPLPPVINIFFGVLSIRGSMLMAESENPVLVSAQTPNGSPFSTNQMCRHLTKTPKQNRRTIFLPSCRHYL